jgi:hypothetical protein
MRLTAIVLFASLVLIAASASTAAAHHAFAAEFDANKQVTLKGTIAKMDWINPHAGFTSM